MPVRLRPAVPNRHPATPPCRRLTGPLALALPALLVVSCAADRSAAPPTPAAPLPGAGGADTARDELAARAAAAQDRHLVASYTLRAPGAPDRTVLVTTAADGGWRVDVPGGVSGGEVDVSLAATGDGLFQCVLPSAGRPEPAGCVRLGDPDEPVPHRLDPWVQHPFTDWLDVLTDRRSPLSVSSAQPPAGAAGSCYSVETTSASVNAPLDVGIYCYDADGTPTAVHTAAGALTLAGAPAPGPVSVQLPGPTVEGGPAGTAAPGASNGTL
ncbi:hypothetical protein QTQ03_18030 [Micromonospora sp. WMMA1363]|uniref:hypothetical protein n=1 Tax=Micromonospora sp. WMMA1363 TaxID=3053985 RepID=UPI00259CF63F|nr:hypothetical protein [Micromonospora sp. WMMA1363]MDM4721407.1 hypothetical protein [Micromonospora sp. WMMA1363]